MVDDRKMTNALNTDEDSFYNKYQLQLNICMGLALSSLCFIIPYLQNWGGHPFSRADADIPFSYQALVIGDGRVPNDVSHTGYLYFLLQSYWYSAGEFFGLLDVSSVTALMKSSSPLEKYQEVIAAGRNLSLFLGFSFTFIFYFINLAITRNRYITVVFTILFALGEGLSYQTILLRTELLSSFFLFLSLFALIVSSQKDDIRAYAWIAGSALFASLAYITKLQSIFLFAFFPIFGFLIFDKKKSNLFQRVISRKFLLWAAAVTFLLTAPAWLLIFKKVGYYSQVSYIFLFLMLLYALSVGYFFQRYKGLSLTQILLVAVGVVFGTGLGLSLMFVSFRPEFFIATANPITHMSQFILEEGLRAPKALSTSYISEMAVKLFGHFHNILIGDFDLLANGQRLGLWLGFVGVAVLSFIKQYRSAIIVLFLILLVAWMQTVNAIRYSSPVYSIFVDPIMYSTLAFLAAELTRLSVGKIARHGVVTLSLLFAAILTERNIEVAQENWTQPFSNVCVQANGYLEPDVAEIFTKFCEDN